MALALIAIMMASGAAMPVFAQNNSSAIFREAPRNVSLSERQRTFLGGAGASRTATGLKMVNTAPYSILRSMLTGDAGSPTVPSKISLRLSDNVVLTASRIDVVEKSDSGIWRGTVEESGGRVTLMWWADGGMAGIVQNEGRYYSIRRISGDLHAIVELSDDRMPPDHPRQFLVSSNDPIRRPRGVDVLTAPQPSGTPPKIVRSAPTGDVIIDVMVAYTKKAASYYGDIQRELIDLSVEEANQSFRVSNLGNVKLRLVHAYETDYVEEGTHFDHVWRLADKGDGYLEEVHALRDRYRADVVVLIVDDSHGCGLSTRVHADADEAFAVVHHDCAVATLSVAHEIGHIIGARHDLTIDKEMTPFPYGHGYVNGTKWRDIMSYKESCGGCRRVPIWSSPKVLYDGAPAGTPEQDNGRVIAEEAARVAAFR
jgi:hypothetical protein